MNSEVHPVVAALVLLLAAVALAIWTWGSDMAAGFGGPAELVTAPNGHHFVQIRNQLIEHDADGAYLRTHDLEKLDVEVLLGGIAFFANGDLLMRRGPDPRSFFDNLRAFQRQTNQNTLTPETGNSGLFRCNLEALACTRFGSPGIDFKAAFGVHIDRETGDVYIADTTRHRVRKYSAEGHELAEPATGFEFPNQVRLHEGQLLVADTNNHVIRKLDPRTAQFGTILASHLVVPAAAKSEERQWPSHFARVGEEWWVNVMKTAMDEGGLYVFDDDWDYLRTVTLPPQADPITILPLDDEVWVSDWNNDRVMRFRPGGERLPDLESPGLETVLSASRVERQRYRLYSYAGIALIVLLLLGLLVRGLAVSMNKSADSNDAARDIDEPGAIDEPLHLVPDARALRRMTFAIAAMGIMTIVAVLLVVVLLEEQNELDKTVMLLGPLAGLLAIIILLTWVHRANYGTAIRLDGSVLTLRDHTGRESSSPISEVRYDATSIATHDSVIFLGRPLGRVYSDSDVRDRLLPRLQNAQKVSPLQMMRIQVQLWHPQGIVALIALAAALIYGASLALGPA